MTRRGKTTDKGPGFLFIKVILAEEHHFSIGSIIIDRVSAVSREVILNLRSYTDGALVMRKAWSEK